MKGDHEDAESRDSILAIALLGATRGAAIEGGELQVFDTAVPGAGGQTFVLATLGWKGLGVCE